MNLLSRTVAFLDDRTGLPSLVRRALDEPVPGGARWARTTGGVLLCLVALQALTGFVLALYYAPSVGTAWASIVFFEERIRMGRLVRGLHGWGASAIVLGLAVHYVQVVWYGAYRKPREVNWALGLGLAVAVLVIAHTGYLLPWDQKGYWATKVATGIAGATPVFGHSIQTLAQGGDDYGNLTLTHFFAIHAILMPGVLVALIGLHVHLSRRHGPVPAPSLPDGAPPARRFPRQTLRTAFAFAVVAAGLFALVHARNGTPLGAPADPASDFKPRPEWYFLPLFELLKKFPGSLEFVGSTVVPGLVFVTLLLLPWIDRSPTRSVRTRVVALAVGLGPLLLAVLLGLGAALKDADDSELAGRRLEEEKTAALARRLFLEQGGAPPEGGLALLDHYPPRLGARIFAESCAGCHKVEGKGGEKGPDLTGYLSQAWLAQVIQSPQEPRFFGQHGFKEEMGPQDLKPDELDALAVYTRSLESEARAKTLDPAKIERGAKLFDEKGCLVCHCNKGVSTAGDAPNLGGYGSAEWLATFIVSPSSGRFYGERNKMPTMKGKLKDEEVQAVVVYLRGLAEPQADSK